RPFPPALLCSATSLTNFTTLSLHDALPISFPLIVKLPGAAARSVGLGVIAQTPHRVSFSVRLVLPTRLKPLAVWLYTSTRTAPALSLGKRPDRLVWSVGHGTVSVVPPLRPLARARPRRAPSPTNFTTGNPAPRFAKPLPLIVTLPGAAARSVGLGVTALTPGAAGSSRTSTQSSFPGPSALLPGVGKSREPAFVNGDPAMFVNVPAAGSYHRAVTGPLSVLMSTVTVRAVGT